MSVTRRASFLRAPPLLARHPQNWLQVEREAEALLRDLEELDARLRGTVVAEVVVPMHNARCVFFINARAHALLLPSPPTTPARRECADCTVACAWVLHRPRWCRHRCAPRMPRVRAAPSQSSLSKTVSDSVLLPQHVESTTCLTHPLAASACLAASAWYPTGGAKARSAR